MKINILRFSLKDSSDEGCVFAGVRKPLFVHKLLSLLLNEFLQSEIMHKHVQSKTSLSLMQLLMKNLV